MTFDEILNDLKEGKRIRRQSWYSTHSFPDGVTVINLQGLIADDWEVIEEQKLTVDKQERT